MGGFFICTCLDVDKTPVRCHVVGAMELTDQDIRTLRREAGSHGDPIMVATCNDALGGDTEARDKCEDAVRDASDQYDREEMEQEVRDAKESWE